MDLVSIIIPIYNSEHTLMRCVKSITKQTFKNIQIILVDDGSKDNSLIVAKQLAKSDERIIVLTQENSGAALARRKGFKHATGNWIMFVDSDDTIESCMVQELVNKCHQDDSEICICGYSLVSNNNKEPRLLPYDKEILEGNEIIEDCIKPMIGYDHTKKIEYLPGFFWNKLFREEIINDLMFFSDKEYFAEDALLQMYAFEKATKVSILNKSLYNYHITSDSLTNGYRKNGAIIRINTYNKIKDLSNKRGYADIQTRLNYHLCSVIVYIVFNAIRGSKYYKDFKRFFLQFKHSKEFKEYSNLFNINNMPMQYRKIFIMIKVPRLMYYYYRNRMRHLNK